MTEPVSARHLELIKAAESLRGSRKKLPADKVLLLAGCVLTPLGLSLILVGWYGAARTSKQYEQIDYLISGGILGGTLAIIGAVAYVGHWVIAALHAGPAVSPTISGSDRSEAVG